MTLGVSLYPGSLTDPAGPDSSGLSYRAIMELGKLAEDEGFDSVFGVEWAYVNDVMATVEALALATHRITVGAGIANLYYRHPAILGAGAVAIDELSDGRLILGIGVSKADMVESLGLTWREPRTALRETTQWLRQVFAGEKRPELDLSVSFRPAQHLIPIHFAGTALETAELAGEIADGLMVYIVPKVRFQQAVARVEQGARKANRNPQEITVSLLIPTFLSDDLDTARQAARQYLRFYSAIPLFAHMYRRSGFEAEMEGVAQALVHGDQAAATACISDRLMDEVFLVGPEARCKEQLAAFREAGVTYPILAPQAVQQDAMAAGQRLITAFGLR